MKYPCLFLFFLIMWCTSLSAQQGPLLERVSEQILLRNAAALRQDASPNLTLDVEQQRHRGLSQALAALQRFMNEHPCTSLQILEKNQLHARADYRANNRAFWVDFFYEDNLLQKIVIRGQ